MGKKEDFEGAFAYKVERSYDFITDEKTGKIIAKILDQPRLEDYSGRFKTFEDARKWFRRYGKGLENEFNRNLILCCNGIRTNYKSGGK